MKTPPILAALFVAISPLWDGGIRVPMIVRGPGIMPGSQFTGNVVNYDFLPTFVDWAGGDPKAFQNLDGVSLAGYMRGQQPEGLRRAREVGPVRREASLRGR